MKLASHSLHLWQVFLPDFVDQIDLLVSLLNGIELERAERFRMLQHRQRFIIARAMLKKIIHLYTGMLPETLVFGIGEHGKPFLQNTPLQFNVSHSHEWAVYGFCQHEELGIDIEKNEGVFKETVAKRFFRAEEYAALMNLPLVERANAFYEMWTKKESVIKAMGQSLPTHLKDFTVHAQVNFETLSLNADQSFYVYGYSVTTDYPVAVVSRVPIKEYQHWQWDLQTYRLLKKVELT